MKFCQSTSRFTRHRLLVLLLVVATLFAASSRLSAQTREQSTATAERKDVVDPLKKPDPRESEVPGEEATDAPDEKEAEADDEKTTKKDEDTDRADEKSDGKKDKDKKDTDEPKPVVTHGSVKIDGENVAYTATAGKMVMKTDEGDPKAHVFFVAYTKDEPEDDDKNRDDKENEEDEQASGKGDKDNASAKPATRPITFCFNGGPGSSSVWLHLGMLGPVRVKLDSDAKTLPPPHELTPNHFSLLDITDLVFIDPVGTGYSRPAKDQDKRQFHGYDEDLRSIGQFVHDYTTTYGRWSSPKFLIGESYGGLRAAGLSGELQQRYRMYLNGIVLVSAVVDFQTLATRGRNDIAYALFLPNYASTAWYHKTLSDELQNQSLDEVVRAAERFALGPYLRALAAGDSLSDERRQQVVERMSELTGLSKDYIEAADLRVSMPRFGKELLRKRSLIVGRFDSRYAGHSLDPLNDMAEYDPSASAVFGTFTSALNDYVRSTLKVEEERVYEILTNRVHPWDYSEFTNRFVDASETLREAMTQNPYLKVFAACGYYDLATPSTAMKYTRDHLHLAPELRDQFSMDFYEAGHMMYAHEPSLEKLRDDLVEFYQSALKPLEESNDNGEED
jgi:carboxypeptidase C (cathepsin A)